LSTHIQIVALSRYIDSCPDSKHIDCPYRKLDDLGNAGCGEECRVLRKKLIFSYKQDSLGHDTIDFDAASAFAIDRRREPDSNWKTSSLVTQVLQHFTAPPFSPTGSRIEKRAVLTMSALTQLVYRGYPVERIIREGCVERFSIGLSIWVNNQVVENAPEKYERWWAFSTPSKKARSKNRIVVDLLSNEHQEKIKNWFQNSSIEDLLFWKPNETLDLPPIFLDEHRSEIGIWLADRSTRSKLQSWQLPSLALERKLAQGSSPLEIVSELRQTREIDLATVNSAIANHFLDGTNQKETSALQDMALEHLRLGDYKTASALFSGARALNPNNGLLTNNLAFCQLPDSPGEALKNLDEAERLGFDEPPARCNRAFAWLRLERFQDAIDLCESMIESDLDIPGPSMFLWKPAVNGEVSLEHFDNMQQYAVEIALAAARQIGSGQLAMKWQKIAEKLAQSHP
jgi:tetratricopeptide (TPR) repeat protein